MSEITDENTDELVDLYNNPPPISPKLNTPEEIENDSIKQEIQNLKKTQAKITQDFQHVLEEIQKNTQQNDNIINNIKHDLVEQTEIALKEITNINVPQLLEELDDIKQKISKENSTIEQNKIYQEYTYINAPVNIKIIQLIKMRMENRLKELQKIINRQQQNI